MAGLSAIYAAIRDKAQFPDDPNQLGLATVYACLAVTPALMLLTGFKNKTWHWVFISIVEVIVITVALYALLVLIALASSFHGEFIQPEPNQLVII